MFQPQLFVSDGRAALAFYLRAFGAEVLHQVGGTDVEPAVVAQLRIDESTVFFVTDEGPDMGHLSPARAGGTTVRLTFVTDDPDAVVERVVAEGATLESAVEEAYGWRVGRVRDPFGHQWEIGHELR